MEGYNRKISAFKKEGMKCSDLYINSVDFSSITLEDKHSCIHGVDSDNNFDTSLGNWLLKDSIF